MKILNKKIITAFILTCFMLSGCAGESINFAELNSKKPDLNKIDFNNGRDIVAKASSFQLFLFIPIGVNSRHEKAFQRLKDIGGNDYITDIQIQESWSYAFVGTAYKTKIKARAYPYKK
jgi:uncharacterized lipoprotein YehR (DUF1307 family)